LNLTKVDLNLLVEEKQIDKLINLENNVLHNDKEEE
jgi:hypothetical protein